MKISNSFLNEAIGKVLKTNADRDKFIKSIVDSKNQPIYSNYAEFEEAFLNANPSLANTFYPNLLNQIGVQFVERSLEIDLPIIKNHFKGKIPYGDFVNLTWNQPNNVIAYSKKLYTPADYETAGATIYPVQIQQNEPAYIKATLGNIISAPILRASFTEGTIPAFNSFIADLAENMLATLKLYYYPLQMKILSLIGNVYQIGKIPTGITNTTQWKLSFIYKLYELMKQPSYNFNALGIVDGLIPAGAGGDGTKKITKNLLVPTALSDNEKLCLYTTPEQKQEFATLGYSTTFNEQFINSDKIGELHSLNIDVAYDAPPAIVSTISPLAKAMSSAYKAITDPVVYMVQKDAIQVFERFDENTNSIWAGGQEFTTKIVFANWLIAWNNVAIRADLKIPTT